MKILKNKLIFQTFFLSLLKIKLKLKTKTIKNGI